MEPFKVTPVKADSQILEIANLAEVIWHEHFTKIIGEEQVNYMVEKFQSYAALKEQLALGYEYFQLFWNQELAGYAGIHQEDGKLFLSKLYVKKDFRGNHISTKALNYLKTLAQSRSLSCIWLTCNRHNDQSLAVYNHLGFHTVKTQVADIGNGYVMDDYVMELSLTL
ncbi:MAG: GNAT family N-acetyltransferase [Lachnospiraceae bacterium]|nr:GNAT family N-acetyltransferase [Lachnospiraceae bacterium]